MGKVSGKRKIAAAAAAVLSTAFVKPFSGSTEGGVAFTLTIRAHKRDVLCTFATLPPFLFNQSSVPCRLSLELTAAPAFCWKGICLAQSKYNLAFL